MRKHRWGIVLLLTAIILTSAQDAVQTEMVHFARGTSSKTIKRSITGYTMAQYLVGVQAKQTIIVSFQPNHPSCYFNVVALGADSALFDGSMTGDNHYEAVVPSTGNYAVQVYLMRNAARRRETCRSTLDIGAH